MPDQLAPSDRDPKTIAWLESQNIVTTSAQRLYFELIETGVAPDQALAAALDHEQAEAEFMAG